MLLWRTPQARGAYALRLLCTWAPLTAYPSSSAPSGQPLFVGILLLFTFSQFFISASTRYLYACRHLFSIASYGGPASCSQSSPVLPWPSQIFVAPPHKQIAVGFPTTPPPISAISWCCRSLRVGVFFCMAWCRVQEPARRGSPDNGTLVQLGYRRLHRHVKSCRLNRHVNYSNCTTIGYPHRDAGQSCHARPWQGQSRMATRRRILTRSGYGRERVGCGNSVES